MMTKNEILQEIKKLDKRHQGMIEYLNMKVEEEEWHGVEDAASDLRDIEAALAAYHNVLEG